MFWRLVAAMAVFSASWCGVLAAPPVGYYASAEGKSDRTTPASLTLEANRI